MAKKEIAVIAAFNSNAQILWGRRRDNGKWTTPAGHLEEGEAPLEGAKRELFEEAGLEPSLILPVALEEILVDELPVIVHAYVALVQGTPTAKNDPDEEIEEWRWVDPNEIPSEIRDNLHVPAAFNVILGMLQFGLEKGEDGPDLEKVIIKHFIRRYGVGLSKVISVGSPHSLIIADNVREFCPPSAVAGLDSARDALLHEVPKYQPLHIGGMDVSKSLRHAFMALAGAAAISTAGTANANVVPQSSVEQPATEEASKPWTPNGLHQDLYPIAQLESSFGKNVNHAPHSKGDYHTAFGAVGFKVVTAHEEYLRQKHLKTIFPGLEDQEAFTKAFKTDPAFYNAVASAHWKTLKHCAGGDPARAAYSWRWGIGAGAAAQPETVSADPYVQAFRNMHQRLASIADGQTGIIKSAFEKRAETWLAKKTPTKTVVVAGIDAAHRQSRAKPMESLLKLYDMKVDAHDLLCEKPATYASLGKVERALDALGYHGYTNFSSINPSAIAVFSRPRRPGTT